MCFRLLNDTGFQRFENSPKRANCPPCPSHRPTFLTNNLRQGPTLMAKISTSFLLGPGSGQRFGVLGPWRQRWQHSLMPTVSVKSFENSLASRYALAPLAPRHRTRLVSTGVTRLGRASNGLRLEPPLGGSISVARR